MSTKMDIECSQTSEQDLRDHDILSRIKPEKDLLYAVTNSGEMDVESQARRDSLNGSNQMRSETGNSAPRQFGKGILNDSDQHRRLDSNINDIHLTQPLTRSPILPFTGTSLERPSKQNLEDLRGDENEIKCLNKAIYRIAPQKPCRLCQKLDHICDERCYSLCFDFNQQRFISNMLQPANKILQRKLQNQEIQISRKNRKCDCGHLNCLNQKCGCVNAGVPCTLLCGCTDCGNFHQTVEPKIVQRPSPGNGQNGQNSSIFGSWKFTSPIFKFF